MIRSPSLDDVLDDLWLRRLHQRMFGDVWSWAGTDRRSGRNIGIDSTEIPAAVRVLVEDCRTWIALDDTRVPVARFHHRLVAIHPFPNGNGRHSRAAAVLGRAAGHGLLHAHDLAPCEVVEVGGIDARGRGGLAHGGDAIGVRGRVRAVHLGGGVRATHCRVAVQAELIEQLGSGGSQSAHVAGLIGEVLRRQPVPEPLLDRKSVV